jgi:succinoglycan biosynthesis protein ExoO
MERNKSTPIDTKWSKEILISVIIPAYNVENFIAHAIESVLNQTIQDFEIIVIDDGSTDQTAEMVTKMNHEKIRLYINFENKGPSYSRNRAIELSKGKWIAVLDADDWWHENRLFDLLAFAKQHKADIVADDLYLIHDGEQEPWTTYLKSRVKVIGPVKDGTRVDALRMIQEDYGYLKPIISKAFIKNNQLKYKNDLCYGEDFRFVLECLIAGGQMRVRAQPFYYYRIRAASLSSNVITPIQAQIKSTNELIEKYAEKKDIIRALTKYKNQKQLILIETTVRGLMRQGKLKKSLLIMMSHPLVIKPWIRGLIRSWRMGDTIEH